MKIIDPHIHLFDLAQGEYLWLKELNPPFWEDKSLIRKTFTEHDLTLNDELILSGFVHIEAGFNNNQPWRELQFLESSCVKPFKAIANIDFTLPTQDFVSCLEKLAKMSSFVGVRHILDDQSESLLSNKQVLENFIVLNSFAKNNNETIIFELQLSFFEPSSIYTLCDVIRGTSSLSFIINHAGFPPSKARIKEKKQWHNNLIKISNLPNVAIKCSGWEMNDRDYQEDWLTENLTDIFNVFGAKRMLLASNFPLCLFSKKDYLTYWQTLIECRFFNSLTQKQKNALCYDNALRLYSIDL